MLKINIFIISCFFHFFKEQDLINAYGKKLSV